MENLRYYEKLRQVPSEAKKQIGAGRLKGMTDINPMWRIKKLTETFGPCGIGWYPEIVATWLDDGANGEISANMKILLYVKEGDSWSKGIPGIGGSKFVAKETAGLYTDDEAYKKAFTDAISVAAKLLGVAADVYFEKDTTKYDGNSSASAKPAAASKKPSEADKPADKPKFSLDDAMSTPVVLKGVEYKLGALKQVTLEWYAEKSKNTELREKAALILRHRFAEELKDGTEETPFGT